MSTSQFETRKQKLVHPDHEEWMQPQEKAAPPKPVQAAAIAGFVGAMLVFAIQVGLQLMGRTGAPTGTFFAYKVFGMTGLTGMLVGTFLFCLAGAIWAAIYARTMPEISSRTGVLFSFAPWLVLMLVVYPIVGKPVFAGGETIEIMLPLVLSLLWGSFVGAFVPLLGQPRLVS